MMPLLKEAAKDGPYASVVNIGSYDGYIADPALAAYCATKGAVHALTKAMACDHGPQGVRVNSSMYGFVPWVRKKASEGGLTEADVIAEYERRLNMVNVVLDTHGECEQRGACAVSKLQTDRHCLHSLCVIRYYTWCFNSFPAVVILWL